MSPIDKDMHIYRLAFSMIRGCNLGTGQKILSLIGDEKSFFELSEGELRQKLNVKSNITDSDYRKGLIELASKEFDFISQAGINAIFFSEEDYPCRLMNCDDAPVVIYTLGSADLNASKIISIVGTRNATAYGRDMTQRIVSDLASAYGKDVLIVSGLAYGIDVAAHRAALSSNIPTLAVTAHPLNTIYPAEHRSVAIEMIQRGGGLLTEYTSSNVVHRGNFLQRNRIIAGLADATLVVESDMKGGSLVTASIAGAYDRDVFAVPGRTTDRYSRGTNKLIAGNKAVMVRDVDDIIDAMRWERKAQEGEQARLALDLSSEQVNVITYLREHPNDSVNELSRGLGVSFSTLTTILFELEMSDLIVSIPGNRYTITSLAADI